MPKAKTMVIQSRLTERVFSMFKKSCRKKKITMSEVIRQLIIKDIDQDKSA